MPKTKVIPKSSYFRSSSQPTANSNGIVELNEAIQMLNKQNFEYLLKALEITEIIVSMFAISPTLGILAGTGILIYLLLLIKNNQNGEEE